MSQRATWLIAVVWTTAALMLTTSANAQSTWYVDDNAPDDPAPGDTSVSDRLEDGSAAHPFDAIQEGVDAAVNGDTVLVLDGTYTGVGNRDVELSGLLITVRSESGAATCLIDCQQAGRAFLFAGADSTGAVVEGFIMTNGAPGSGGGAMLVHVSGSPTVSGCVLLDNSVRTDGGAVANVASQPEFIGCSFVNNSAEDRGGAIFNTGGYLKMTDCTFSGNSVSGIDPTNGGGAIYSIGGAAMITNCDFEGHSAKYGGAIYLSASHAALTDCDLSGNTAAYRGGAIYNVWLPANPPVLERCTFTGNSSDWDGGAIYNGDDAMITVRDCTFTANSAYSGGGALCNLSCGDIVAVGSNFTRNGSFYGGAIYNQATDPTLTNCHFDGNAANQGGAIYIYDSSPTITNGAFSGNSATYGGGIMVDNGNPGVTNCTFCGNEATQGGGLSNWFGVPALANCVFWGNAGGEIFEIAWATVRYSDVQGGYDGVGNIDADPLFVATPDPGPDDAWGTEDDNYGDLHPQAGSPCVDAADNTAVPPDTADLDGDGDTAEPTPLDLDGLPRCVDDPDVADTGYGGPPVVDMGACEFQVSPPLCPGDLDCSGLVDFGDIDPFVAALGCPDGDPNCWDPTCPWLNGDCNGDETVDFGDIDPFVARIGASCP